MTQQLTPAEKARTFDRHSTGNAEALKVTAALRGCTCQAYVDWFTYRRWQAQGMQVQKDEKATKLPVYYNDDETDKRTGITKTVKRRSTSCLFCRCQVQPKEARSPDA